MPKTRDNEPGEKTSKYIANLIAHRMPSRQRIDTSVSSQSWPAPKQLVPNMERDERKNKPTDHVKLSLEYDMWGPQLQ
jgi:hypothetical protein